MVKFMVKLDMRDFFDDERKFTVIMADSEWPNIGSLGERIQELYNIEEVQFMSSNGFYLPLKEPIDVIKHFPLIKVLKCLKLWEKKTKLTTVHRKVINRKWIRIHCYKPKLRTVLVSKKLKEKSASENVAEKYTTIVNEDETNKTRKRNRGNRPTPSTAFYCYLEASSEANKPRTFYVDAV